jgi:predicted ATPase
VLRVNAYSRGVMNLSTLSIKAFRSLYDVTISPGAFTVLTGPNNSGKTNVAESLDFLGDVHRHGLESAVIRKGGFENIAHRRMRRTRHGIAVFVAIQLDYNDPIVRQTCVRGLRDIGRTSEASRRVRELSPVVTLEHSFEIRAAAERIGSDFSVVEERLVIRGETTETPSRELARLERAGDDIRLRKPRASQQPLWQGLVEPLADPGFARFIKENVRPVDLAFSQISFWNSLLRTVESSLSRTSVFQLAPPEARRAGIPTPNPELERHGGNLPALVRNMQMNDPDSWKQVFDAMLRIVPTLEAIQWDFTSDLRLTLKFVERGVGRAWSSQEISDGTIQSLAMFCALHDRRSPLTIIEEPENSVHPWIIRTFVDVCRDVAEKQVILTTHSPALLNYLRPSEIMVVWRQKGQTHVAPLADIEPDIEELWESGKARLFEFLDSGWLLQTRPEGFR